MRQLFWTRDANIFAHLYLPVGDSCRLTVRRLPGDCIYNEDYPGIVELKSLDHLRSGDVVVLLTLGAAFRITVTSAV